MTSGEQGALGGVDAGPDADVRLGPDAISVGARNSVGTRRQGGVGATPVVGAALVAKGAQEGADATGDAAKVASVEGMSFAELFNAMLDDMCATVSERYGLSRRETQVLVQLVRGRSLQAIADSLSVAYSTVKTHTDHIYAKTGVHSRQELMALLEQVEQKR